MYSNEINNIEIDKFIGLLKEKNRLESTIEAYQTDLNQFFTLLNNKNYAEISEKDILDYIKRIREDYTQSTVFRKVINIKAFFKQLFKDEKIEKFIAENIKIGRQNTHIPEILSEEEIYYILENCDDDEKGSRDYLIIKILYETGILISDLLQLKIENMNDYKFLTYESGKKSYVVTLGKELGELIKAYIDTTWSSTYKNEAGVLFPGLSRQNFAARLKKYSRKAGINRSIYPNMLRNTLAVNLLDNGSNIREIKDKLNYVNIAKSGIYTIRNKNNIKEMYDKIAIGDWNVPEDF
jgi:integrase/recombinase XerD